MTRLAAAEIGRLDPDALMALMGKRFIHPGGRAATASLLEQARFTPATRVLDAGCGVATTAIEIARRHGAQVTAVDISPLMLERAERNVRAAGVGGQVTVRQGDILDLPFGDGAFDVVVAEAVTMFVDRRRAASELARVTAPGGRVLATEFFWRRPPTEEARRIFVDEVCPGLRFDSVDDWVELYCSAGLEGVEAGTGPFLNMTVGGFLADEGVGRSLAIMARGMLRLAYIRRMAWLMPRIARAVPCLGHIVVAGTRPAQGAGPHAEARSTEASEVAAVGTER